MVRTRWLAGRAALCMGVWAVLWMPPDVARASDDEAYVTIETDRDEATLNEITSVTYGSAYTASGQTAVGSAVSTIQACRSPCRRSLSIEPFYYVGGPGISPSRQFLLPSDAARVHIKVDAGSRGVMGGAIALTTVGAVLTLLGGTFLAVLPDERATWGVVTGASLALLIPGIIMIPFGRTKVSLRREDGGANARAPFGSFTF